MDLASLLGAAGMLVAALLAGQALVRFAPADDGPRARPALDGLRGLLTLLVFIATAAAWHGYVQGRGWRHGESRLFMHFGQTSIALLLMTTAFLHTTHLLEARGKSWSWLHLYVSRMFRLTPAWLLAMALMMGALGYATVHGIDSAGTAIVLRTWDDIVRAGAIWVGFTILGTPAIDGYLNTGLITAGLTWPVPWLWMFYCLLPLLAVPLRVTITVGPALLAAACALWIYLSSPLLSLAWPFAVGVLVALLARRDGVVRCLRGARGAALVAVAMVLLVAFCATTYGVMPLVLCGFAFTAVATGNDLLGLLAWRGLRLLGRVSWSAWLMQPIALYAVLMLGVGPDVASRWSAIQYWAVMAALSAAVPVLAFVAWRLLERPAQRGGVAVERVLSRLRARVAPTGRW